MEIGRNMAFGEVLEAETIDAFALGTGVEGSQTAGWVDGVATAEAAGVSNARWFTLVFCANKHRGFIELVAVPHGA